MFPILSFKQRNTQLYATKIKGEQVNHLVKICKFFLMILVQKINIYKYHVSLLFLSHNTSA